MTPAAAMAHRQRPISVTAVRPIPVPSSGFASAGTDSRSSNPPATSASLGSGLPFFDSRASPQKA